jgi:probable phosphoglycerate mutase
VLALPGPRLVIGHGLMLSILLHLKENPGVLEDRLPEAPYVSPLCIADDELRLVLNVARAYRT